MPRQHFTRVQHQYYTRVPCTATTRVVHACTAYYTRGKCVYSILHAWYTRVQHTTRVYTHGVMPRVLLCKLCACVMRVFCVCHTCLLRVARVSSACGTRVFCVWHACNTRRLFKLWVICTVRRRIHIHTYVSSSSI